jgi:hypothetical protein
MPSMEKISRFEIVFWTVHSADKFFFLACCVCFLHNSPSRIFPDPTRCTSILWFQTCVLLWILYSLFWMISRRQNFLCRHFWTLCLFKRSMKMQQSECQSVPDIKNTVKTYPTRNHTRSFKEKQEHPCRKQEAYTISLSNMKHQVTWHPNTHHADRPLECHLSTLSHIINTYCEKERVAVTI